MYKISIITATLDSAKTLASCLDSVKEQGVDVEHILVDGGSSDATLDIAESYDIDKLISGPDQGIYDAMNKGIKLATGDVIGILNADDFYASSDVLHCVLEAFKPAGSDSIVNQRGQTR